MHGKGKENKRSPVSSFMTELSVFVCMLCPCLQESGVWKDQHNRNGFLHLTFWLCVRRVGGWVIYELNIKIGINCNQNTVYERWKDGSMETTVIWM